MVGCVPTEVGGWVLCCVTWTEPPTSGKTFFVVWGFRVCAAPAAVGDVLSVDTKPCYGYVGQQDQGAIELPSRIRYMDKISPRKGGVVTRPCSDRFTAETKGSAAQYT